MRLKFVYEQYKKKIGFMVVRRDMRIDWVNWTKKTFMSTY